MLVKILKCLTNQWSSCCWISYVSKKLCVQYNFAAWVLFSNWSSTNCWLSKVGVKYFSKHDKSSIRLPAPVTDAVWKMVSFLLLLYMVKLSTNPDFFVFTSKTKEICEADVWKKCPLLHSFLLVVTIDLRFSRKSKPNVNEVSTALLINNLCLKELVCSKKKSVSR